MVSSLPSYVRTQPALGCTSRVVHPDCLEKKCMRTCCAPGVWAQSSTAFAESQRIWAGIAQGHIEACCDTLPGEVVCGKEIEWVKVVIVLHSHILQNNQGEQTLDFPQ